MLHSKRVSLDPIRKLPRRSRLQVRNLQKIGQNIVTVETKQRVQIKKKRRNRRGENHVERE